MRIISGKFKGKRLYLPNDKHTRPLKDIVKESIFNLIKHSKKINTQVEDSLVLDLFSGTGSFGIECISRGAKKVFFFENYPEALKILKKNLNLLKDMNNYEIYEKNFFNFFLSNKNFNLKFDIIFIDPPYRETKINEIIFAQGLDGWCHAEKAILNNPKGLCRSKRTILLTRRKHNGRTT